GSYRREAEIRATGRFRGVAFRRARYEQRCGARAVGFGAPDEPTVERGRVMAGAGDPQGVAQGRTGLSRGATREWESRRARREWPVLVLQGGNALNYFGTGLILPFEIIYLHTVRGFSTATAGLVLATVMGTAGVVTLPSGALLDRFSAKRILIAGNVVNALGYGGLAF